MRKKIFVGLIVFFFSFGLINLARAHNPRLVYNLDALPEKPIMISNPDISQAFYGRLKGWEEYYQFTLASQADFYWQTLVPDVKDISKDISADLIDKISGDKIATLAASSGDWKPYYEKFAGDNYFAGASSTINLKAGTYLIKVYNPNNEGKYVLVVGQKEFFTPKEMTATIISLPTLKTYFNKSPLSAYFNYIGLFLAGGIIIFLIIYFIFRFFILLLKRL